MCLRPQRGDGLTSKYEKNVPSDDRVVRCPCLQDLKFPYLVQSRAFLRWKCLCSLQYK